MTAETSTAMRRVTDFLAELGPRWGLPAEACRVHGYLYLVARPQTESELRDALALSDTALNEALAWLADYRLIERARPDAWRTESDPWDLMMHALEERRRREIGPALDALREAHRAALAEGAGRRTTALQIGKLLRLAEDLAAIDAQARRLSPSTLRQMVGFGALAARFVDRTFGRKDRT